MSEGRARRATTAAATQASEKLAAQEKQVKAKETEKKSRKNKEVKEAEQSTDENAGTTQVEKKVPKKRGKKAKTEDVSNEAVIDAEASTEESAPKDSEQEETKESKAKKPKISELVVGEPAPQFTLPNKDGTEISLSSALGKYVVLYFYPKDNTPGCTKEAQGFQSLLSLFTEANAVVFGVSADSQKSHQNFCNKYDLTFELLSDSERQVIKDYHAANGKSTKRSTVIIDPQGKIAKVWSSVSGIEKHPQAVLDAIKGM